MLISPGRIGRIGQPTGPTGRVSRLQSLLESLYGNGEQGAFYVPKPQVLGQQVLFQDAAGTTPVTAPGDPVGLMLDLSGNDNHATQEVSGSRPVYRTDGTRHWLEFDGVDDYLDLPLTMAQSVEGLFISTGFEFTSVGGGDRSIAWFSTGDSASGTRYRLSKHSGSNVQVAGRRLDSDSFDAGPSAGDIAVADTPQVLSGQANYVDATAALRQNGVIVAESPSFSTAGLSDSSPSLAAYIGRQGDNYTAFQLYGLALRAVAHSETAQVERYMANLAGVTLDD